jgi:hypothetical protein
MGLSGTKQFVAGRRTGDAIAGFAEGWKMLCEQCGVGAIPSCDLGWQNWFILWQAIHG